ncbi:hypothetical protein F4819DRAFT_130001 [Hypoxylon fuscum]|nr:hypothetical protein F4819DRAFT_130001 [Hypoxylon fuscum]
MVLVGVCCGQQQRSARGYRLHMYIGVVSFDHALAVVLCNVILNDAYMCVNLTTSSYGSQLEIALDGAIVACLLLGPVLQMCSLPEHMSLVAKDDINMIAKAT